MTKELTGKATLRAEQETILNFEPVEKLWHISTDVPLHIKRYIDLVDEESSIVHKDKTGKVVYLKGVLQEGTVLTVRSKPVLSKEQREETGKRLKESRSK